MTTSSFPLRGDAKPRPTISALALSMLALALATGCGGDRDDPRGTLVSITEVAQMTPSEVRAYLKSFELDDSRVEFGVEAHRIVYRTIDPAGNPTTASGPVAWPRERPGQLRLVSWMHGTTVYRHEVASENAENSDRGAAFLFAAAGYAVSAPDYLGLGAGPGFHPFDHFASAATAAMDALRATRVLVAQAGHPVDDRVLVSGFSQGGPSGMALGRVLQGGVDANLRLGGLAFVSAPFDVSGTLATGLTGNINLATAYLAYLMIAWNRLHHLYDTPADAFRPPYHEMVETLFDNEHPPEEVLGQMPAALDELFTPQFLDRMRTPTGSLKEALRVADATCDWRPAVPVRLYAATGDRDVPIANSAFCQQRLRAQGVEAVVVDLGEVDHGAAFLHAMPRMLAQFDGR